MSVKISGQVWELSLDPIDKLVLLALADHADHEGNNVRPGNRLLIEKTGLSQPTISAKIKKFIEDGILDPQNGEDPGRGGVRAFTLDVSSVPRRGYFIEREEQKKVKAASRLSGNNIKAVSTLSGENIKAGDKNIKADNENIKADSFLHDKERARVEPSEPSIEPSERESAQNPRVSFVKDNHNQPFSPNDDFDTPPPVEWTIAERFVLKACDLWDALTNQEKPIVETNCRTKQAVQIAGKYVMPRLSVENRIGGTPKLFREFWHDKLKRDVAPRPDYLVEQWEAYDRWLIENYETHRRITNAA